MKIQCTEEQRKEIITALAADCCPQAIGLQQQKCKRQQDFPECLACWWKANIEWEVEK